MIFISIQIKIKKFHKESKSVLIRRIRVNPCANIAREFSRIMRIDADNRISVRFATRYDFMLRFIQRTETDPYYNLAAEEYLLKTAVTDTFMIWRNEPAVIVGKHQNALKEINLSFVEEYKLPVIRRITGGGTVYHDPGNLNFSFIFTQRKENLVDFKEFTKPVISFLQSLGLNAAFEGKNNITVDGLKVSGNSAHLFKNKVLYHGTLLFDASLEMLEQAIAGQENLFHDKAVRSVRARVVNISDKLDEKISCFEFSNHFKDFIFNYFDHVFEEKIKEEEDRAIRGLAEEKYRSHQWNFGYSPEYEFNNKWIYKKDEYSVKLVVKEGKIIRADLTGPEEYSTLLEKVAELLAGTDHERNSVRESLTIISDEDDMPFLNQILNHLFYTYS